MARAFPRLAVAAALALLAIEPASAQYRRQIEELPPIFATSVSLGMLLPYEESVTPIVTPPPDGPPYRTTREIGVQPAVSAAVRYGRGIAIYGTATLAFGGTADLSGTDPLTADPVAVGASEDVGLVYLASVGASFQPIRDALPVRLDIGPALLGMGDGGSYFGVRLAAAFRFLEIRNRGGAFLGWEGFIAGGQDDQDDVEYQLHRGLIQGVRLGFEVDY